MSWAWFALRQSPPPDAHASAPVRDIEGGEAGFLVAWPAELDRPEGAAKIDERAVDPDGPEGWVSLVLPPGGITLPFDDPAVGEAIRRTLLLPPADVCSTLSAGDDRWLGSLTATFGDADGLDDDAFALLFPARRLRVGAGFLGRTPGLPGPVMQRAASAGPWPAVAS